jgi:natural product precursor
MKKFIFENLSENVFTPLEVEKMKRIKGGYTASTFTCYSNGGGRTDGTASQDGVYSD